MQGHHRQAALAEFLDLVVGREATHEAQGDGLLFEHPRDRLRVGAPAEADVTGVGYLVGIEAGVLGLEVDASRLIAGGSLRRCAAPEPKRLSMPSSSKRPTLR